MASAELLVKPDGGFVRRVHQPGHTTAPVLDRHGREMSQQKRSDALATELRTNVQILKIQAEPAYPRRVHVEPERDASGLAMFFGDRDVKPRSRAEAVLTQIGLGHRDFLWAALFGG